MEKNFKIKRKGHRNSTPLVRYTLVFHFVFLSLMTISIMTRAFVADTPPPLSRMFLFFLPVPCPSVFSVHMLSAHLAVVLSGCFPVGCPLVRITMNRPFQNLG